MFLGRLCEGVSVPILCMIGTLKPGLSYLRSLEVPGNFVPDSSARAQAPGNRTGSLPGQRGRRRKLLLHKGLGVKPNPGGAGLPESGRWTEP